MSRVGLEKLIFPQLPSPLSGVPFHEDVSCIQRFFSERFPFHLAVHRVTAARPEPRAYTRPHAHDVAEINMIIDGESPLEYAIQLGDEIFEVRGNTSVWIPPGLKHAANVIRGSGFFVALRMDGPLGSVPAAVGRGDKNERRSYVGSRG